LLPRQYVVFTFWLVFVYTINPDDEPAGFRQELLALWQDPQVRSLALKWAGDVYLAEDVLQTTYCRLRAVKHLERIDNLRAYFLTVLKNEVYRLYVPRRVTPLENPEDALHPGPPGTAEFGRDQSRPVDEAVCIALRAQYWLKRFADERDCLLAAVSARSADPDRYRAVICAAAEQVLHDGINGEPSEAGTNAAFRAAYPEYFDQRDASANACHQRFRRAREDVKAALQAVVRRDELI
jgi:DNA-directed RNA polymerase specialized sigma24 family protein